MALLGPNGSGKTTTLAILLGLLEADRGQATLFGSPPAVATGTGRVGVMLQDAELMAGVGVRELLCFVRGRYPFPAPLELVVDAAALGELLGRRTDRLSTGQAQRVRFALAAVGAPALLVLDEPTAAMDPQARRDFWAALRRHSEDRCTTVLFSTHYLEEADEHAGRIVLLGSGRILADGTPAQVKAAGGADRVVRFRLLHGRPEKFRHSPGVTARRRSSA